MAGGSKCWIPGCPVDRIKYKIQHNKSITMFSVPKNEKDFEKWSKALQRFDKKLTLKHKICELHFNEDSINRFYDHQSLMPDGTIWKMDRTRFTLKKGSVPTIFPDLQNVNERNISKEKHKNTKSSLKNKKGSSNENLESTDLQNIKKRKTSQKVHSNTKLSLKNKKGSSNENLAYTDLQNIKMRKSCQKVHSNTIPSLKNMKTSMNESLESKEGILNNNLEHAATDAIENSNQAIIELTESFSYISLINNLELILKPHSLWGISIIHDKFLMCAKWNQDSILMKRVIIDCNLKVQVYFKNKAIDFDNITVNSVEHLCCILKEIDRCGVCINADNKEKADCDGYMLPNTFGNLCRYCQLVENCETNKRGLFWLSKGKYFNKHQILYDKVETLSKTNMLLKEKLSKIIKIKAIWRSSSHTGQNETERRN